MSNYLGLRVGDHVKLVGPDWGGHQGTIVTVDRVEGVQAFSNIGEIGSLTSFDGEQIHDDYAIERVVVPTTQGYTLSLYVSKTEAAEFPGETREVASIKITHDDLAKLLTQGKNILDVVQDG